MRRLCRFLTACSVGTIAAVGCSSDPNTPLGESFLPDSLIRSRPGAVLQDTIAVASGDTAFAVNSYTAGFLTMPSRMVLGRDDDFQSTILLRVDFSKVGAETLKTVTTAQLWLPGDPPTQPGSLGAFFFELAQPLKKGDTLTTLLLADTIPDGTLVNVNRTMSVNPPHALPPSLVQDWIRGVKPHNGVAIVLNDTTTSREMTFATRTNKNNPFLQVFFSDNSDTTYRFLVDGTFVEDLAAATGLRVSDGATRRIYLPVDLSSLDEKILLHQAELVVRIVPSSASESGGTLELYAPGDSLGTAGVLKGTGVASRVVGTSGVLKFPIRNVVSRFLADPGSNRGFAIRFLPESNSIRRIEFFSSASADSLKPKMLFTYSKPPSFPDI